MIDGTSSPAEGWVRLLTIVTVPQEEVLSTVTTARVTGRSGGASVRQAVPLRWNPVTNVIQKIEQCELVIRYVLGRRILEGAQGRPAHIDLLVLHPDEYGAEIARYITHKESMGWTVKNASCRRSTP